MRDLEPDWSSPYAVDALGEDRFDRLTDALAAEPCPLLDAAGRCAIYADRPLVCRMIGLGMRTPTGRAIENGCPIQDRFPGYRSLSPSGVRAGGVRGGRADVPAGGGGAAVR